MTGVRRPTMKGGRARISGSEFDIRKYFCGFIAALIFAGLLLPPPVGAQRFHPMRPYVRHRSHRASHRPVSPPWPAGST
jgi:hypothetical protein